MKKIARVSVVVICFCIVMSLSACGQKEDNIKITANQNYDKGYDIDAYKGKIQDQRVEIKTYSEQYKVDIEKVKNSDSSKINFQNCEFKNLPENISELKVFQTESHGITAEESWNTIEKWLKQIGKYDQTDMKNEVHVVSAELGVDESKEYPDCYALFYENMDQLSSGEGAFIDNQLCHIQIASDGIYSMSNGKITERLGVEGKSALDALGIYEKDIVDEGSYTEMKDKSYLLNGNNLTVERGAELVKTYFLNGTPFEVDTHISLDIPEVRVFQIRDFYGYDYMVRRTYEDVPFAWREYGVAEQPDAYSVTPDIKHAYMIDETGVCAFAGYNESEKLNTLYEDSHIIDLESASNILKDGLARHITTEVISAEIVYLPVDMAPSEVDAEKMVYPCWEFKGVNTTKNENIQIYVDVFTGEIYYYTTSINE